MKKTSMLLALPLLLGASLSFASQIAPPEVVAQNSPEVKNALGALNAMGFVQTGPAVSVIIAGQCGFAGCSSTHLVLFRFSSGAVINTRTQSVVVLVRYGVPGQAFRTTIVDTQALLGPQ